jgi:NAD(P)-dependent dehydrogenase (short-subunit alcohol dehydrogenase family)
MLKKVLVTGGTSGIGREFVDVFAKNGFEVWFTYFSHSEKPAEVADSYPKGSVTGFKLDLADYASIESLASALPSTPDVLIHNAGLGSKTVEKVSNTPQGQAEALIKVNAIGLTISCYQRCWKEETERLFCSHLLVAGLLNFLDSTMQMA